ncbi:MAG: hypothetical protein M3066_15970 [Actinomycetota bacterium]|nr:hypothetical protein [Actinomycetota bacterium]
MRPVRGGPWWALAFALLALFALIGFAGPAAADTTVQVDPGYAGAYVPGQAVPVRVAVSADRLLRGTLEVAVGSGAAPVAMAVEVPGGSQKQFLVVAPGSHDEAAGVVVRLRESGRIVASGGGQLQAANDQELVGLLPGALHGRSVPGPAPLAVDAGTARFAAVGEAELDAAPGSLGPLSTLGMDTDELARMAPGARAGVLSWVQDGGRLLVDAGRGQPVPGLPDEWQPGARGRVAAGLGEVVATDGAMAASRWANLVEPTSRTGTAVRFPADASVASSLASAAGLRSPRLGWLVGYLAFYVVLVGPVLFLAVRRRRRPELAWVAVPLVALLFSTGSYAVGRNLRTAAQLVHGSVLSTGPGGATVTSYVGVFSRGGRTIHIGFPAGASVLPLARQGTAGAGVTGVSVTSDGSDAQIPLDAGQFGMVAASGPVAGATGLQVSSAVAHAGGGVTGTVRNLASFRVDDVAIFAGQDGTLVGSLAPGEQRDWTVANPIAAARGGVEFQLWNGAQSGPNSDAFWDPALWQAAARVAGSGFRAPGTVVAAGWTRDFAPAVRLDGRAAQPGGRTVVVTRSAVALASPDAQIEFAARTEVVRDPFSGGFGGGGSRQSVVRFVLPDGAPTAGLIVREPFANAELWQDGAWRPAACSAPNCTTVVGGVGFGQSCPPIAPCGPPTTAPIAKPNVLGGAFTVPDGAVRDGVVYARVPGPASPDEGVQVTLGRAT